ncbi:hypothetical protein D0865_06539 [Hortaea werneckii]|uniref:Uncharacterized protein n=1 Tax=Hortaea werneckii TaxID=91943 RepID=A0A3M7CGF8_HORWE|nr:hypothetical protein D0865_06539 [Hortaea werneckii]
MFSSLAYGLIFFLIIAMNHKYGKPWEDAKTQKDKRARRRKARYEKNKAAEQKEFEESQQKRREAKRKRRQEDEKLGEIYGRRRPGELNDYALPCGTGPSIPEKKFLSPLVHEKYKGLWSGSTSSK